MYRIELSPGEETVFRSIEELAVAIKRGVVTPRARIYHNASSKWLPIQFHPHYRTALSMPLTPSALVAGPPVKPLSNLSLEPAPVIPEPPAPSLPLPQAQAAKPSIPEPEPAPEPRKKRAAKQKPASDKRPRSQGKQRKQQLRIALIGALLLGGAQWVLSEPLFSREDVAALFHTHRRLLAAPANSAAMIPVLPAEEPASAASFGGRTRNGLLPTTPAEPPASVDTAATDRLEPAPAGIDVGAPEAPRVDSLARKSTDSTEQRAIKGILRAVSGTSSKEPALRHR